MHSERRDVDHRTAMSRLLCVCVCFVCELDWRGRNTDQHCVQPNSEILYRHIKTTIVATQEVLLG